LIHSRGKGCTSSPRHPTQLWNPRMSEVVPILLPCAFMVCPRPTFSVFYLLLRSLVLAFDKDQAIYVFFNNSIAVSSSKVLGSAVNGSDEHSACDLSNSPLQNAV
jgi:nicotinic acid mononucleotide adenylyltransferase